MRSFTDSDDEYLFWSRQFDEARLNLIRLNGPRIAAAKALLSQGVRQFEVIRETKLNSTIVSRLAKKLRDEQEKAADQQNKAA
jgi:hypothetical protein